MDFRQAVEYLENFSNYEKKTHQLKPAFSLGPTMSLLARLGDPHHRFEVIHVAGTVGKGSVCRMVDSALRTSGIKTGLYTSPHLLSVRERIETGGKAITEADFAAAVCRMRDAVGDDFDSVTFFELLTAMAFDVFASEGVEVAVVETGLGGRLDSTNAVRPFMSVITRIGRDHRHVLGRTLAAIAAEKAGIIKPGGITVCAPRQPAAAMRVITGACAATGSPLVTAEMRRVKYINDNDDRCRIATADGTREIALALSGDFQRENLATALAVFDGLARKGIDIASGAVAAGLSTVTFAGRMQWVEGSFENPPGLIVDGGHNEPAARAAAAYFARKITPDRLVLVIGMMRDKEAEAVLSALSAASGRVVLTGLKYGRAATPGELLDCARRHFPHVVTASGMESALSQARVLAGADGIVAVTGSLYAVAEVLQKYG